MIDRSSTRDSPTLATAVNAASLLGTRVADTSSAASIPALKPYIWAQAIRITLRQILLQAGGRPHMVGQYRHVSAQATEIEARLLAHHRAS